MQVKTIRGYALRVLLLALLVACGSAPDTIPDTIPNDWEPQLAPGELLNFRYSVGIAIYQGDIWATTWALDSKGEALLFRYRPTAKTVKPYTVQLEQGTGIPTLLLTTAKGELWGAGMNPQTPAPFRQDGCALKGILPWVLSRYNPATDRFEAIQDRGGLLRGCEVRSFVEDQRGNLWLLVHFAGVRPGLFRFNPLTAEATLIDLTRQLDTLSLYLPDDIAIGPDGAVWMQAKLKGPSLYQPQPSGPAVAQAPEYPDRVVRYDPETGTLQEMGTPGRGAGLRSHFYFDRHERLWTSLVSWTDLVSGRPAGWHDLGLERFVIPVPGDEGVTMIASVWQIYQSPDGLTWFASDAGLITYDIEKNTWKRVSPSKSVIVQDEQGYMWTATMGQIYRFRPTR